MLSMTDTLLINDLINVCQDGQQFYKQAAKDVENRDIKALFHEMAAIRADIADDLSNKANIIGIDKTERTSVSSKLQRIYSEMQDRLTDYPHFDCIIVLEASEDRALQAFCEEIHQVSSPILASEIAKHLATIQITHDRLKQLKNDSLK
jgi:uncharacterized protein (TIGR02284 family)